jgi:2-aminoadipate transaminase
MSGRAAPFRLSSRARRSTEQPISYLMAQAVENPHLISLAAGLVDYETLPCAESAELAASLLRDPAAAKRALQYGTTPGLAELRTVLLEHIASLDGLRVEDLDASPEDVFVTTGSQQLLFLLTQVLVDPGDIVITEWPSYFVYTGALRAFGAELRCVDIDDEGMVPEALEDVLGRLAREGQLHRVKIVYLVDYFQNPTGITLSAARRPAVLEVVRRFSTGHRILVIEDAAYRELSYDHAPPPSIKSHDRENLFVALAQTFSKPFSPGLKTGYGLVPRDLVEAVAVEKGSHDFGSANFNQALLLAAMKEGVYARHVDALRRRYAAKRDAMLEALDTELSRSAGPCRWTRPDGGLYVWLTLPDTANSGRDGALFGCAVAEGVLFVPGEYCFPEDPGRTPPRNAMRLSFGTASIDDIREGVRRLGRAIRSSV